MKNEITISITVTVLTCLALYFLGAFYSTTFNISEWNEATRGVVCFGGTMSMFVGAFVFGFLIQNK